MGEGLGSTFESTPQLPPEEALISATDDWAEQTHGFATDSAITEGDGSVATFVEGEGGKISITPQETPTEQPRAVLPESDPLTETAAETKREELALASAIAEMPPAEREEIGWKLHNIGFQIEKLKSTGLASGYGWLAEQCEEKPMLRRFFGAMKNQFAERVETTQKQMEEIEAARNEGKAEGLMKQLGNAGYLSGNLLKYGRVVSDLVGWTAGTPTRWVTLGAMATGSVLEGAKEARLENEEVKEQTRVQDIEKAAEEAWAVYEGALRNKGLNPDGEHEGISKEELIKAYQEKIPADILRRLAENPKEGTGSTLVQKMFQKHIGWAANRIQKKLDAVEGATLDEKTKAAQKEAIIGRFGRSKMLGDFDRMLAQEGTIDALAMSARYGEKGAKMVVYGMMADSLYRLWDRFGEAFAGRSWDIPDLVSSAHAGGGGAVVAETIMTPEELDVRDAEARAILEGGIAALDQGAIEKGMHTVVSGDTLGHIAKGNMAVLRLSPDELRAIGVSSGDPNMIKVGEKIDTVHLEELLNQKTALSAELHRIAPGAFAESNASLPVIAEAITPAEIPESDFTAAQEPESVSAQTTPPEIDQEAKSEAARVALEEQFERERLAAIEEARTAPRGASAYDGDVQQPAPVEERTISTGEGGPVIERGVDGTERAYYPSAHGGKEIIYETVNTHALNDPRDVAFTEEFARSKGRMPTTEEFARWKNEQYALERGYGEGQATTSPAEEFPGARRPDYAPGGRGYHLEENALVPDRRLSEITPRELARWPAGTPKPWPVDMREVERSYGNNFSRTRITAESFRFKVGRYPNEDELKLFSRVQTQGGDVEGRFVRMVQAGPYSRMQAGEYERMIRMHSVARAPLDPRFGGRPQSEYPFDPRYGGQPQAGYTYGVGHGGRPYNPFEIGGGRSSAQSEILEQRARNVWLEERARGNPNADANFRRNMEYAQRTHAREVEVREGRAHYERKRAITNVAQHILGNILRRR